MPELAATAWDCFWDLTGERPLGFGAVGQIPWSTIAAWADRHGIHCNDQFERLKRLVVALDRRWLEHLRASAPTPPPSPGAG
ncbi:phage tail assembly chaperone [Methylobacterium nodulans]|uniref:phage tail assembly chaperone n=1 Tax=Methylobacterium nodulans TaxID=114616 RepID=UPI0005C12B01